MNKSARITVSVFMVFSATIASAAGMGKPVSPSGRETQLDRQQRKETPAEKEARLRTEQMNSERTQKQELIDFNSTELADLTKGAISKLEMRMALGKDLKLSIPELGFELNLDKMATAEAILKMRADLKEGRIADNAKKEQLKRAIQICSEFLALGKGFSRQEIIPENEKQRQMEISAWAKQAQIISEMSSMTPAELKSHLDVMERANILKATNPEWGGEKAYAAALKEEYKGGYAQKLMEILRCVLKG